MVQVNDLKKVVSYLFPIRIRQGSSAVNPVLELFLYRGEFQLATEDALYSDSTRYRPLVEGFRHIQMELKQADDILMLGAGLGSGAAILNKMAFKPNLTLVDVDELVIQWAKELMDEQIKERVSFICEDADAYIKKVVQSFDVVVVDVFRGRVVPAFVTGENFLTACKDRLKSNGILIINYMLGNPIEWEKFGSRLESLFSSVDTITIGINKIVIAKAGPIVS